MIVAVRLILIVLCLIGCVPFAIKGDTIQMVAGIIGALISSLIICAGAGFAEAVLRYLIDQNRIKL